MANSIKYFETPIKKHWSDVEKGDVIRMEFGDYDNFVTVIFEELEIMELNWIRTIGRYVSTGEKFEGFGVNYNNMFTYTVIGKEIK